MRLRDLLPALTVVFMRGVNFAIIELGLRQVPPLGLGIARFALSAFPWIFFVERPSDPLRLIAAYGLLIFATQFAFLFTGMKLGMSAGLASLLLQLQAFFTIALSVLTLGERPTSWQLAGALLASCGVALVALHIGGDVTAIGLMLVVAAAAFWGGGNIVSKRISRHAGAVNTVGLVVWGQSVCAAAADRRGLRAGGPGPAHLLRRPRLGIRRLNRLYRLSFDAFRLRRMERVARALSPDHGRAFHLVGAGVRIPGLGRVARRAVAGLETGRLRSGHRGSLPQPLRSAPSRDVAEASIVESGIT